MFLGLIDHTHPTAPELLDDAVMRDGLPDHCADMLGVKVEQVNSWWAFGDSLVRR